jgi:pimeloyl-ACP methyl ester carboxylesterase
MPNTVPEPLRKLVRRAVAARPEQRFPSVRELEAGLAQIDLSGYHAPERLLPEQRERAPFAWAAAPLGGGEVAAEIERRDFRLSALAVDPASVDEFRRASGFGEMGWSVYGRTSWLGPIGDPAAFARATEVVVLLHGMFGTRAIWDETAQQICRDNGHTLVLVPDLHGCGETRYAQAWPDAHKIAPPAQIAAVQKWIELLGIRELPVVLIGHSMSGAAVLSASDDQLSPNVYRVALAPVFPAVFPAQRWGMVIVSWLITLLGWSTLMYRWMARKGAYSRQAAAYTEIERQRAYRTALECTPGSVSRLARELAKTVPAPRERLERALVILIEDDPLLPERYAQAALRGLGLPEDRVFRLISGGHSPYIESEAHPEWRARNVREIVGLIESVLDQSRVVSRTEAPSTPERYLRGRSGETATEG